MSGPGARKAPPLFLADERLHDVYRRLTEALAAAAFDTPDLDARFLLQGLFDLESSAILLLSDQQLGSRAAVLNAAVCRRFAHEPVSRILGVREFYGRPFKVTAGVLDPRPDTETLIDAVLTILRRRGLDRERGLRIADIGVGSGAILLTLLAELPLALGVGTDVSRAALAVAAENAARLGVADRAEFVHGRGLTGVRAPIAAVVSNPPYIPAGEIPGLDPCVRGYDPMEALDGGPDGYAIYREISLDVRRLEGLRLVALEVGAGQAEGVADLFSHQLGAAGGTGLGYWADLGGHTRCVTLERQS